MSSDARGGYRGDTPAAQVPPPRLIPSETIRPRPDPYGCGRCGATWTRLSQSEAVAFGEYHQRTRHDE